jgi:O-antigen/teichoic acid export membrane protein
LSTDAQAGRRKTQLALTDQAVVSGANFLAGLLLGRFLGPTAYGQFTLTYNIVLLAASVQFALIAAPMLVIGPQQSALGNTGYYRAVLVLQGLFSLLLGVVALLGVQTLSMLFPGWGLAGLALPVSLAMVVSIAQDFLRRYCFVRNQGGAALFNDIAAHGAKIVLLCALGASAGLSARSAFWVVTLSSSVGILAIALRYRWWLRDVRDASDVLAHTRRQHWHAGKWLLAENIVYWFGGQMVIFYVAGHVLSATAVGNITAAMNVVGAANILFLALENFVPSRAAQMYARQGRPGLKRYLRRVTLLGAGVTFAIIAIGALWGEFWLTLLYGPAYAGNGSLVAWCGAYYMIGFLQRPLSFGLRVLGSARGVFFGAAMGASVSVALSYPLIRAMGITGAMLALCAVQAAVLLATALSFRRAWANAA